MDGLNNVIGRLDGVTEEPFFKKLLFKIAMVLVIVGALNWLSIGAFDVNLVASLFPRSASCLVAIPICPFSALLWPRALYYRTRNPRAPPSPFLSLLPLIRR